MATAVRTVSSLVLFDTHNAILRQSNYVLVSGCGMLIRGRGRKSSPLFAIRRVRTAATRSVRDCHMIYKAHCVITAELARESGITEHCTDHDYKYILTVKDCFSKYCWLSPLRSKEAAGIALILGKIFLEYGPPKFLHSHLAPYSAVYPLCCVSWKDRAPEDGPSNINCTAGIYGRFLFYESNDEELHL